MNALLYLAAAFGCLIGFVFFWNVATFCIDIATDPVTTVRERIMSPLALLGFGICAMAVAASVIGLAISLVGFGIEIWGAVA